MSLKPRTRKSRRLILIAALVSTGAAVTGVSLWKLSKDISLFITPTQLATMGNHSSKSLRIGGLVESGSVKRSGSDILFRVTDLKSAVDVHYIGILPDLFREGQGVVATGQVGSNGVFEANQILAKHDEKYMPPEAAEALKQAGTSDAAIHYGKP